MCDVEKSLWLGRCPAAKRETHMTLPPWPSVVPGITPQQDRGPQGPGSVVVQWCE